jgi:hypothetical protein
MLHQALVHRHPFERTVADRDDLEPDAEIGEFWMSSQPGLRRVLDSATLLVVDHLERITVVGSSLLLDLTEDKSPAAADDQVELVAARNNIRLKHPVPPQAVVARRSSLPVIHRAP